MIQFRFKLKTKAKSYNAETLAEALPVKFAIRPNFIFILSRLTLNSPT